MTFFPGYQVFLTKKGGQEASSGVFRICSVASTVSLSALNVPKELCQAAQNISGFWKWSDRVRIPCTIIDTVYYRSWELCEIFLSLLINRLETETAKHTMTWTDGVSTVLATSFSKWARKTTCQQVVPLLLRYVKVGFYRLIPSDTIPLGRDSGAQLPTLTTCEQYRPNDCWALYPGCRCRFCC